MRYRQELPLVLKDVSFKVNSKEKIGIVGRTGSGRCFLTSVNDLVGLMIYEPINHLETWETMQNHVQGQKTVMLSCLEVVVVVNL